MNQGSLTIAHTVAGLEPAQGGLAVAVAEIARSVAKTGHDVRLFRLQHKQARPHSGFDDIPCANALNFVPILKKLGVSPNMQSGLFNSQADLFHAHGIWMMPGIYAANAAKKHCKPFMLSPHGMLTREALKFSPRKKKLFGALSQNAAFKAVSCLHATAPMELEEVRSLGFTQPVALIPNGMHLPDLPPRQAENKRKSVLSLGRLHWKKGNDRLVKAWALIEPDFPEWHLDIVGPDEKGHTGELKALVRRLGLGRVHISGPVYGEAKWSLYRNADLFALATLTENFGLTVPEALACETPVICTQGAPWQGLQEERCGWWIQHGPEAMAAALREAVSLSDAERHAMGERGRKWVAQDFSWETIGKTMSEVYLWLAGKTDRPECVCL